MDSLEESIRYWKNRALRIEEKIRTEDAKISFLMGRVATHQSALKIVHERLRDLRKGVSIGDDDGTP